MKSAARLTSSLLARKGYAIPCDIRSSHAAATHYPSTLDQQIQATSTPASTLQSKETPPATIRYAFVPPSDKASPEAKSDVSTGQEAKDNNINKCSKKCSKEFEDTGRVAMTLRLDGNLHKRLKLISVHSQRSARDIITAALDGYLDKIELNLNVDHCHCLQKTRT